MHIQKVTLPNVAGLDVEDAKQALRSEARAQRKRRPAGTLEQLGEQWVSTALDFVGECDVFAGYVSVKSEPPTRA